MGVGGAGVGVGVGMGERGCVGVGIKVSGTTVGETGGVAGAGVGVGLDGRQALRKITRPSNKQAVQDFKLGIAFTIASFTTNFTDDTDWARY